jgi:hypothetical protein
MGKVEGTYCWVQAQGFVYGAVEVRDVRHVVAVEVGFSRGDGVEDRPELGLGSGILAELVGEEGQGYGGCVTAWGKGGVSWVVVVGGEARGVGEATYLPAMTRRRASELSSDVASGFSGFSSQLTMSLSAGTACGLR